MKNKIKSIARILLKIVISSFDFITRRVPLNTYDIIILSTFSSQNDSLKFDEKNNTMTINYSLKSLFKTILYIRRCTVLYVDNINIVVASLKNLDCTVIQVWHATSAVKKFGLPTVSDTNEYKLRKKEFENYDYVTANSTFMHNVFTESFDYTDNKILDIGCLQSKQLFEPNNLSCDTDYIIYVPTFRWEFEYNKPSIDFIQNFKSDKYTLIYSLHPKVDATINNPHTKRVDIKTIRDYFANASLVISDYSSLLVDASLLCNKVVMYGYDYDHYSTTTGLNITKENFWGYYTEKESDLIKYIETDIFNTHDLEYIKNEFFTYDDLDSTTRIKQLAIDIINNKNSQ